MVDGPPHHGTMAWRTLRTSAELGRLFPVEALRSRYQARMDATPVERTISYDGSGVTSAYSVLTLLHIGPGQAQFFAGSWSEWTE